KAGVLTGINKDSVKLWVNDELMDNVLFTDNPDGTISVNYTPSALKKLRPGPQVVKLRVEDNYGNITIKKWQFFVAGDYVGVDAVLPQNEMIYAGDVFGYIITANTYKNFEKLEGTLTFNNKALEILNVAKVDSAITLGTFNLSTANSTGELKLLALGMNKLTQPANQQLINITFRTKEGFRGNSDTAIEFKNVTVKETGYDNPTVCMLPSYEVKVNYRYILTYITSTVGRDITFKVTDNDMNPVEGAHFVVEGVGITLSGRTDRNGNAAFAEFKNLAADESFKIYAIKGSYYSEKLKITMVNSLGSEKPYNIVVGPGSDASRSVNISWQTNLQTQDTAARYRKSGTDQWIAVTEGIIKDIHVVSGTVMREYLAHIITIDNLEPNTQYQYQVGADLSNDAALSSVSTFKTAPVEDISFLFLGDPQNSTASGYEITKNLIEAALFEHPSLAAMLIGGDIVDDVNMYSQWQAFASVLAPYVNSMITIAASGNHDVIRNYGDPFAYTFVGPNTGVDVLGVCYFVEAGSAAIAVIDTETPSAFEAQAEWLLEMMTATKKKFKFVLMHRSAYAANYNEPHIRNFWPAVFDEAGVDLVLSGHDHVYNSTTMYDNKRTALPYGVLYVVGGSAGSKFYNASNLDKRPWIDFLYDDDKPIFTTIDLVGEVLTLKSYALISGAAAEINRITIDKSANKAEAIVIENPVAFLTAGTEYEFNAYLLDRFGAAYPGAVICFLAEEVEGITVSEQGKLTISAEFKQNIEVEVIFSFEDIRSSQKIKIYGTVPTASEALQELMEKHNEFIENIFR
ncbi:MAG: metallophosphoesterase family protein, partial [Bacilli bacterium]|nr:metallophosphoesterase family protein [Bacilli bacterium]